MFAAPVPAAGPVKWAIVTENVFSPMISTVADLLLALATEERKRLDEQRVSHAPTIGAMYEGLTRDILKKAIPPELELQVVQGFAYCGDRQSGQLDSMLVRGSGEAIPYTDNYRWHIKDVIAVLEVKKRLSAVDLIDSYNHLRGVALLHSEFTQSPESRNIKVDATWPARIFSQTTGIIAPEYSRISELPFDLEMIYHTLLMEFLSPVRIVIAHHAWKKESTLRGHIFKMMHDRLVNPQGMGVGSFPQLIIGGEYSLLKANGLPYISPVSNGMWPFFVSTSHNPIRIMLEFIFTRLDGLFDAGLALDDNPEQEVFSPCLRARAVRTSDRAGWDYLFDSLPERVLRDRGDKRVWKPAVLSNAEFVVMNRLCAGDRVRLDDRDLVVFAEKSAGGLDALIDGLVKTTLVAVKDLDLVLTTINCVVLITPDGEFVAGENNVGQMTTWGAQLLKRAR